MKKSIVYAEMGNPWRFPSSYEVASCRIQFKDLHNFGKEGPLCGKLFINDIQLTIPDYDGFGGPIIKNNKYIYLPLYQMKTGNRTNSPRTYIVEIDISKKKYRLIGKRVEYAIVYLDFMVDDILYFYNSPMKNDKLLKYININSIYKPWSWKDRCSHFYHELLYFFHDLFS